MALKLNPATCNLDMVLSPGGGVATIQFDGDGGSAVPTALGVITIAGGTGITTSAAGNTVTIDMDSPVTVANGGTGASSLTDGGILLGSGTSAVTVTAQPIDGQLLIGSTGVDPVLATLTAGAGISVVNAGGSITVSSISGAFTWNEETGTSATLVAENGYIANNAGVVTFTLPATCAVGDTIMITGKGAGGWAIAQNAGQTINLGSSPTTTGVGGSLASTNQFDTIEFLCITANTDFNVLDVVGNITVV